MRGQVLPSTAEDLVWVFPPLPAPAAPLAQREQFSLNSVSPQSQPQLCFPGECGLGGKQIPGLVSSRRRPASARCVGAARRDSADGGLRVPRLRPARLLQPVRPLGCHHLPARGARSFAPRLAPRLRALSVEGTGGGRADGDVWEARRVLFLRASPQTASRVPFPAPCAGVSARVYASAGVSVKCVCAGGGWRGRRGQGAGEGAGRECVRACNSTPGLCASPGDSIGGSWRRSGRRRRAARPPASARQPGQVGARAGAEETRAGAESERSPGGVQEPYSRTARGRQPGGAGACGAAPQ